MAKQKILGISIGIFLLIVIVFGIILFIKFGAFQSVIDRKDIFIFDYQNIGFRGQTAILGSQSVGGGSTICEGGSSSGGGYSNSYSVDSNINLVSSMSVSETGCGNNYIWIEGIVPSGDLNVDCSYSAKSSPSPSVGATGSSCQVLLDDVSVFSAGVGIRASCDSRRTDPDPWACSLSGSQSFSITLNESSKVKIQLTTSAGDGFGATASSNAVVRFEKSVAPQPITQPEPSGWDKFKETIKNLWCKLLPFFCN